MYLNTHWFAFTVYSNAHFVPFHVDDDNNEQDNSEAEEAGSYVYTL